ncbi:hypothetical protein Tco_0164347 [Tanacetum coccineum]
MICIDSRTRQLSWIVCGEATEQKNFQVERRVYEVEKEDGDSFSMGIVKVTLELKLILAIYLAEIQKKITLAVLGSRQQLAKPLQIEDPPPKSVDPPPIVEPDYGQVCEQCDAAECFKSHAPNGSIKYNRLSREPPKVKLSRATSVGGLTT